MAKNYLISGEWNVTCDVCSKKLKTHETYHRWDGFIVCKDDFEQRHPQDFVRAKQDKITVPFQRPIPELVFISDGVCTAWTMQGVADQGTADCARADIDQDLTWNDWIGIYCSINMQASLAEKAIAGCAIAGKYTQGSL